MIFKYIFPFIVQFCLLKDFFSPFHGHFVPCAGHLWLVISRTNWVSRQTTPSTISLHLWVLRWRINSQRTFQHFNPLIVAWGEDWIKTYQDVRTGSPSNLQEQRLASACGLPRIKQFSLSLVVNGTKLSLEGIDNNKRKYHLGFSEQKTSLWARRKSCETTKLFTDETTPKESIDYWDIMRACWMRFHVDASVINQWVWRRDSRFTINTHETSSNRARQLFHSFFSAL